MFIKNIRKEDIPIRILTQGLQHLLIVVIIAVQRRMAHRDAMSLLL